MQKTKRLPVKRPGLRKQLEWYSFLLPTMACLILLTYIPMGKAIVYSLNKISKYGTEMTFVGFKNYINLLNSERFLNSIGNTFVLAFMSMISVPLGFLLAIGLQEIGKNKVQTFFRITYYLPNIITGVSIVLIFRYILMQQGGLLGPVSKIINMQKNMKNQKEKRHLMSNITTRGEGNGSGNSTVRGNR